MLVVQVYVSVKAGMEEAFIAATLKNCKNSINEPGVARFDLIQQKDDPTKFMLTEIYRTADAPAAHKETAHYLEWREAVADMMAEPRSSSKYEDLFAPGLAEGDAPKAEAGPGQSIIADNRPHPVELKMGESYWFCTCGRSDKQPFCDGSHKGTDFTPQKFTADEDKEAWLCYCKQTGNAPFCDGTHKQFENDRVGSPS